MLESRPLADPTWGRTGGALRRDQVSNVVKATQFGELTGPTVKSDRDSRSYEERVVEAAVAKLNNSDPKTWLYHLFRSRLPESNTEHLDNFLLPGADGDSPSIIVPNVIKMAFGGDTTVILEEPGKPDSITVLGGAAETLRQAVLRKLVDLARSLELEQLTILAGLRSADPQVVAQYGWVKGPSPDKSTQTFTGGYNLTLTRIKRPTMFGVDEPERIELTVKPQFNDFTLPDRTTTAGLEALWKCVSERHWEPPSGKRIIEALSAGVGATSIQLTEDAPGHVVLLAALVIDQQPVQVRIASKRNSFLTKLLFGEEDRSYIGVVKRSSWNAGLEPEEAEAIFGLLSKIGSNSEPADTPATDQVFISKDRPEQPQS
ncbi:MAG: hypothetical protein K1X83_11125 [Oligoflexia bacterium]|nr:hypothetical protein [Oligoflexia bacterium]